MFGGLDESSVYIPGWLSTLLEDSIVHLFGDVGHPLILNESDGFEPHGRGFFCSGAGNPSVDRVLMSFDHLLER